MNLSNVVPLSSTAETEPWSRPIGPAPTRRPGEALKQDARGIEGFIPLSARLPCHLSLMVFPQNLRRGSSLQFSSADAAGRPQSFTTP